MSILADHHNRAEASRSQSGYAYLVLRGMILRGKYLPGHKLKIQDLATQLDVSPGAVREALSRLVPEQLVVSRDQRGFIVAPLSLADLHDLTSLRCEIEGMAIRRSLALGGVDWEADIVACTHRLVAVPQRVPNSPDEVSGEWQSYHSALHGALVAACGSPRLLVLRLQLFEQAERYRHILAVTLPVWNSLQEHQELAELALARDTEALVQKMSLHIQRVTNEIVKVAQSRDDFVKAA